MRLGQGRLVRIDHRLRTQRDGYVEITAYLDAENIAVTLENFSRLAFAAKVPLPELRAWLTVVDSRLYLDQANAEIELATVIQRQSYGAVFVDVTSEQLDPQTGLIASRFVREDKNHHLKPEPYKEVVRRELAALDW